jgi:hypothetical protein
MSRLAQLQQDLQLASAAVARAERVLAQYPNLPSALATLRTIENRRSSLEEQFFAAAAEAGLDVCGYRIEHSGSTASISGLTAVLGKFQKLFTTVYDALQHDGPKKKKARVSAEVADATSLQFAYTFPGSVGVMMTLPNEKLLFESKLDDAMKKTFELMTAQDAEHIQVLTDTVGLPAVRIAHEWAEENVTAGFGADIAWRRGDELKTEIRVQIPQITHLASVLRLMKAKEQIEVVGQLLDVAITDRTFQMDVDDKIIHGTFDYTLINAMHPVQLPKTYLATLTISQRVALPESGAEQIEYHLLRLDEPPKDNDLMQANPDWGTM